MVDSLFEFLYLVSLVDNREDRMVWMLSSGKFDVKSLYEALRGFEGA